MQQSCADSSLAASRSADVFTISGLVEIVREEKLKKETSNHVIFKVRGVSSLLGFVFE